MSWVILRYCWVNTHMFCIDWWWALWKAQGIPSVRLWWVLYVRPFYFVLYAYILLVHSFYMWSSSVGNTCIIYTVTGILASLSICSQHWHFCLYSYCHYLTSIFTFGHLIYMDQVWLHTTYMFLRHNNFSVHLYLVLIYWHLIADVLCPPIVPAVSCFLHRVFVLFLWVFYIYCQF